MGVNDSAKCLETWVWILALLISASAEAASPFAERLARSLSAVQRQDENELSALKRRLEALPLLSSGHRGDNAGFHSRYQPSREAPLDVLIDLGESHPVERLVVFPVQGMFRGQAIEGYGFPEQFIIELSEDETFAEPVLELDSEEIPPATRPEYPVQFQLSEAVIARYLRIRVLKHWTREDGRILTAFGEVMVISQKRNVALRAEVTGDSFTTLPDWHREHLVDGQTDLGLPVIPEPSPSNGFLTQGQVSPLTDKWIQLEMPESVPTEEVIVIPAQPVDAPDQFGHGFPRRFRLLVSEDEEFTDPRVLADYRETAFPNPGDNPVVFPAGGTKARFVRMEIEEMWHISRGRYSVCLAEMQVMQDGINRALGAKVTASDVFAMNRFLDVWRPEYLVDGFSSQARLIGLPAWLDGLEERKETERQIAVLENRIATRAERTLGWTLTVAGLLVTGSLAFVGLMIVRRKRAMALHQEALRSRIARDLHDDLGSRLGGMRLLSENLLGASEFPEDLRDDLDLLHRSSGEATDAMRDIVWLLDTREASLEKLRQQMKRLLPSILGSSTGDFEVVAAPDARVTFEFRREVLFAFRESLSNAARHSGSDRIRCRVGGDEKQFWFEVQDWGKGFDEEDLTRVNGVANLRKRAGTLSGEVIIDSQPEVGTQVTFTVPLRES
ncbi:MAG: histidine kinase [Verrucomicrobiota bacterium]